MSLHVKRSINDDVLTLSVTGKYSIAEMLKLVDIVRSECDQNDLQLALVDCREMVG
jgi:hypothetical protein